MMIKGSIYCESIGQQNKFVQFQNVPGNQHFKKPLLEYVFRLKMNITHILPTFKKDAAYCTGNYTPISLLCAFSKCLERTC